MQNKQESLEILPENGHEKSLIKWATKNNTKELTSVMLFPQNKQEKQITYLQELAINVAALIRESEKLQKTFNTPIGKHIMADALRQCAKYGLMVGGTLPTAYIMPRKRKVFLEGKEQYIDAVTFLPTAAGYAAVLKKMKIAKDVNWWVNYENDYIEIDRVSGEAKILEKPSKSNSYKKGAMFGVAIQLVFENGTKKGNNYTREWILQQKENALKINGFISKTWDTHPADKWAITCIRSFCKPFIKEGTTYENIVDLDQEAADPIENMGEFAENTMKSPQMKDKPKTIKPKVIPTDKHEKPAVDDIDDIFDEED